MTRTLLFPILIALALCAPLVSQDQWERELEDESTLGRIGGGFADLGDFFWDYLIWGSTPGDRVDYGPYPYGWQVAPVDRTDWREETDPFADPVDPILNPRPDDLYINDEYVWPAEPDTIALRARWGVLRSFGFEATGTELYVKATSTYTPSLFLSTQTLWDDGNDEDPVSLNMLSYAPRFYTSSRWRLDWYVGYSSLFWKDGDTRHGANFGMGMELYPVEPVQLEWRIGAHISDGHGYFDLDLHANWQVWRWVQVYGGYRGFYGSRTSLSIFSAGLMLEFGF